MKCAFCDALAVAHITEVQTDEITVERNLCEAHATERGFLSTDRQQASALKFLARIRRLIEFIKVNDRMPTPTELQQLGAYGMLTAAAGSKEFKEQLAYLETMADFVEKHRRIPKEEELPPDPF
ncbi:MAG TPA: hypothetical protein VK395_32550 [Gemmataceae bacterium]|nr:hypothetical protein [Gemmataceae bacterium]